MATYTGSGGMFTVLGKYVSWFFQLEAINSATTPGTSKGLDRIQAELYSVMKASTALRAIYDSDSPNFRNQRAQITANQQRIRARINSVIRSHVSDEISAAANLSAADLLAELKRQMQRDSEAVDRNSVTMSSISAAASNVSDAVVISRITDISGTTNEMVQADHHTIKVLRDSKTDGATEGSETLEWRSETADSAVTFRPLYELGTNGNRITNGDFESTSSGAIVGWTKVSTTASITAVSTTDAVVFGSTGLQFSATGSAASYRIEQYFSALATSLKPGTLYALGLMVKGDWTTGNATATVGIVGTGYSSSVIQFSTPPASLTRKTLWIPLPNTYPEDDLRLVIRWSGSPAAGAHLWGDGGAPGEPAEKDGVAVAAFPGATRLNRGSDPDRWDFTTTNDGGGIFQSYFTRYHTPGARIALPSSTSGSCPDTLVTS